MKLKQLILELFSSEIEQFNWREQRYDTWIGEFSVNDYDFTLQLDKISFGAYIDYFPSSFFSYRNKSLWAVNFNLVDEDPNYKVPEKINQFKVFSLVGKGVVELIKKIQPPFLLLSFPNDVSGRKSLYTKFAHLLEQKHNYHIILINDIGVFLKKK